MIDQLSPPTRRVVAVGILVLVVLLAIQLVVSPILGVVDRSLSALHVSRERLARTEAISARPSVPRAQPLEPGLVIDSVSAAVAQTRLTGIVQSAAARAGLPSIDQAPVALQPNVQRVSVRVGAVGEGSAIMAFAANLERGRPLIRYTTWQIVAVEGQPTQLRLEGTMEAAWAPTR